MVKEAGCVVLDTIVGGKIRAMYVEDSDGRKLAGHTMTDEHMGHIMINDAMVILADIADETSIFHGLDKVLLGSETFECPTDVPVASPTTDAPGGDEGGMDSSASFSGISAVMAAVVALSAFVF